jgi:serine/threonine protein kinase
LYCICIVFYYFVSTPFLIIILLTFRLILREFRREILIQRELQHPNIVQLYGISMESPIAMILELVPHGNLFGNAAFHFFLTFILFWNLKLFPIDCPFFVSYVLVCLILLEHIQSHDVHISWTFIKRALIELAKGLEYMHSKKIGHFDMKSPNIMLDSLAPDSAKPIVKIADFGTSRKIKVQLTTFFLFVFVFQMNFVLIRYSPLDDDSRQIRRKSTLART